MTKKDLTKQLLYDSVKTLVECEHKHIHLCQQKLHTLFSIAFQYFLFQSTKKPGIYLLRFEDSFLADKLAKKAKDDITRKFLHNIMLPRKMRYDRSIFYLDFFNIQSWAVTKDLPKEKIQGALIVKNTSKNPLIDEGDFRNQMNEETESPADVGIQQGLEEDFYLTSLTNFVPKSITIAFGEEFKDLHPIKFPFIVENLEPSTGVRVAKDLLDKLDD
jgi:hypothetical protein